MSKENKLQLKTRILREIFNFAPRKFKEGNKTNKILAKKFNIIEKEIKDNLEFLFEMHLIKKSIEENYKQNRIFDWEITDRGLNYLEKKEVEKNQKKINLKLLEATIIIAIATALNVLINLFVFFLSLEKSNIAKPLSLIVIGAAIAGLSGYLFKEIYYLLFPRRKKKDD